MAYNSNIDLKIGEVPKTTDPAVFPDMLEIYAALHILGQWTNSLRNNATSGDSNTAPWDSIPFRNWYYVEAARDITAGDVVTSVDYDKFSNDKSGQNPYTLKGAINGANIGGLLNWTVSGIGNVYPMQGSITGLALSTAAAGELVQIGVGPATVKVDGLKAGEPVFVEAAYSVDPLLVPRARAFATENNRGNLIRLLPEGQRVGIKGKIVCVGRGIADSAMLFCPPENWPTPENLKYYSEIPTPDNPGGGDA